MTELDTAKIREEVIRKRQFVADQLAALQRKLEALDHIITGFEALDELEAEARVDRIVEKQDAAVVRRSTRGLPALIVDVLSDAGSYLTPREIHDALLERGWETTSNNRMNVLRNTLRTLSLKVDSPLVRQDRPDGSTAYRLTKPEAPTSVGASVPESNSAAATAGPDPKGGGGYEAAPLAS